MTAMIHPLPEVVRGLALARMIIDREGDDREKIEAAIEVLEPSAAPADKTRIAAARRALEAPEGVALVGLSRSIQRRITPAGEYLGRQAEHFEALKPAAARSKSLSEWQRTAFAFAFFGAALLIALAFGSHVTAKTARTLELYEQTIEQPENTSFTGAI